jgi:hypothetical protein
METALTPQFYNNNVNDLAQQYLSKSFEDAPIVLNMI